MPNDNLDINQLLGAVNQGQGTAAAPPSDSLDAFRAQMGALGSGNTVGSVGSPGYDPWPNPVQGYWGLDVIDEPVQHPEMDPFVARHAGEYEEEAPSYLPTKKPIRAVIESLAQLSTRERTMLQTRLQKAGYLGKNYRVGAVDDATVNAFGDLLQETARQGLAGGQSVSWQDYLSERITAEEETGATNRTQTQTSTSITSKESGRGYIWDAFKEAIGRNPTEAEIDKFMSRLNAKERENPTVTTQTMDADGNMVSNTTGGFDGAAQGDLARQYLMSNPNYAEHEAIAKYMPLLTRALEKSTDLEGGL